MKKPIPGPVLAAVVVVLVAIVTFALWHSSAGNSAAPVGPPPPLQGPPGGPALPPNMAKLTPQQKMQVFQDILHNAGHLRRKQLGLER